MSRSSSVHVPLQGYDFVTDELLGEWDSPYLAAYRFNIETNDVLKAVQYGRTIRGIRFVVNHEKIAAIRAEHEKKFIEETKDILFEKMAVDLSSRVEIPDSKWKPSLLKSHWKLSNWGQLKDANTGLIHPARRGKRKHYHVHRHCVDRLVLEAWKGPPPFKNARITHINGNTLDNREDNLRWKTNSQHSRENPSLCVYSPSQYPFDITNEITEIDFSI